MLRYLTALAILIALLVLIVAVVSLPHNVRIVRARSAYRRMPVGVRRRVRELVASLAGDHPALVLSIPAGLPAARTASKLGGIPYFERDEDWPRHGAHRAPFVGQVRLSHPALPEVWQGCMVSFFATEPEHAGRLFRNPRNDESLATYRTRPEPEEGPSDEVGLVALPVSAVDDDGDIAASLIARAPELRAILVEYHPDPAHLLALVLSDGAYAAGLDATHYALEGTPMFIQGDLEVACPHCRAPMRFLVQMPIGECVLYAFGCDDHPDAIQVEVQCS